MIKPPTARKCYRDGHATLLLLLFALREKTRIFYLTRFFSNVDIDLIYSGSSPFYYLGLRILKPKVLDHFQNLENQVNRYRAYSVRGALDFLLRCRTA